MSSARAVRASAVRPRDAVARDRWPMKDHEVSGTRPVCHGVPSVVCGVACMSTTVQPMAVHCKVSLQLNAGSDPCEAHTHALHMPCQWGREGVGDTHSTLSLVLHRVRGDILFLMRWLT